MTEKRLTYIEDIIEMLQDKMPPATYGGDAQDGFAIAIGMVRAHAKEYRGEWVRANVLHDNEDGKFVPSTNTRFCSACGSEAYWDHEWGTHLFKYCPYCGARMNKGE